MSVDPILLYGAAMPACAGYTISLFIIDLAFTYLDYLLQSKIGFFVGSMICGIAGFLTLRGVTASKPIDDGVGE